MIYLALLVSVLLQSTLLSIPLMIPFILLYFIYFKDPKIFLISFIFGIILDILLLNPIGATSAFLSIFLFIVSAYERKFETETFYFVLIFSFLGALAYSYLFSPAFFIFKALVSLILACAIYFFYSNFWKSRKKLNPSLPRRQAGLLK